MKTSSLGMLQWLAKTMGLAIGYLIAGKLALLLAIPPGYASAVWPAAGIALASVLLWGNRVWPGIVLGSFLVNISTSWDDTSKETIFKSVVVATSIGLGAAIQAMTGAWLIRRAVRLPTELIESKDIILFLVWGGPVACMVGATCAVTVLFFAAGIPAENYYYSWLTWWVGDTIGTILIAPLIYIWVTCSDEVGKARRLAVCVPGAVLFALIVCLFFYASGWEQNRLIQAFERRTDSLAGALKNSLDQHIEVLEFLSSYYVSCGEVDRRDFHTFASRSLERNPGLLALSWDVRVTEEQRKDFEKQIRREGFDNFQITERNPEGKMVRADNRSNYVVVKYIEPFDSNKTALGFDVASEEYRRVAIEKADLTGQSCATEITHLVQDAHVEPSFLVFKPIISSSPTNNEAKRHQHLDGYVAGLFRLREMVDVGLDGLAQEGIQIELFDRLSPTNQQLLFSTKAAEILKGDSSTWTVPSDNREVFRNVRPLNMPGREWILSLSATPNSFAVQRSLAAWSVLAGGLLFTALLGAFLLVMTGRSASVELGVIRRTEQLAQANQNLSQQILERQRAEDSLASERNLLSRLINVFPDLIYVKDVSSRFLLANHAQVHMVGRSSVEELLGKTDADFFPREKASDYLVSEQIVLQEGHSLVARDEHVLDVPTGEYHWISTTKVPLRDPDGRIIGLVGMGRDISQKKQDELMLKQAQEELRQANEHLENRVRQRTAELEKANEALRISHERFERAVHGTNDGIWDWNIQTNEDYFSDRWCELLGYGPHEIPKTFDSWFNRLHIDDRARVTEALRLHLVKREPYDLEYRLKHRNEDYRWFRARGQAIWDDNGNPSRMAGSISDITERKYAEAERDRFFTLSLDLLTVGNFDGYLKRINPRWEKIFGFTTHELMTRPYIDLIHPEDREAATEEIKRLHAGNESVNFEVRMVCRDGTTVWTQWNAVALAGENIFYGVGRDITNSKQSEAELLDYQSQLQELGVRLLMSEEAERRRIAVDIHDQIGQALATCRLQLGTLSRNLPQENAKASENVRQLLNDAIRQTRSLTFDLSPPVLHELGLEPALQWLLEKHQQENGWEIELASDGKAGAVQEKSRILLFRIVRELLANVAKHASATEVVINMRLVDSHLEIEVQDNGVGFDTVKSTMSKETSGGFGLFSIRDRLKHVGGRFQANSQPGNTTILVSIPV